MLVLNFHIEKFVENKSHFQCDVAEYFRSIMRTTNDEDMVLKWSKKRYGLQSDFRQHQNIGGQATVRSVARLDFASRKPL